MYDDGMYIQALNGSSCPSMPDSRSSGNACPNPFENRYVITPIHPPALPTSLTGNDPLLPLLIQPPLRSTVPLVPGLRILENPKAYPSSNRLFRKSITWAVCTVNGPDLVDGTAVLVAAPAESSLEARGVRARMLASLARCEGFRVVAAVVDAVLRHGCARGMEMAKVRLVKKKKKKVQRSKGNRCILGLGVGMVLGMRSLNN